MSKPTLTVTKDFTAKFNETVKAFRNDAVLVGIPDTTSSRKGDAEAQAESQTPITNAALLAINVFGSPDNNIPPRDVMSIGIRKAKGAIAEEYKKAAQNALSKGIAAVTTYYERSGIIAANAIKKAINDQDGIAPPAESTLATRKSAGFKGKKALVVTGQMRNAITSVVRRKI